MSSSSSAASSSSAPFTVKSDRVKETESEIISEYEYRNTLIEEVDGRMVVVPSVTNYTFKTDKRVPRTGLLLVGWGGNNGSTITGSIISNREGINWRTKSGVQTPNYFGSLTQASVVKLGVTAEGREIHVPLKDMVPLVEPNDMVIGGWDISSANLADSMERAEVLDYDLQRQLYPYMKDLVPMPSIYFPDFIAANQGDRADNVLTGTKLEQMNKIREDIRTFKSANDLDKVIVLWTANTERFSSVLEGLNDTKENLMASIERGEEEISPSTLFAVASILEGVPYINGSPQNTFVPGVVDLAEEKGVLVAGDDFKSGQTKMKSVLVDFLVGAGLKPESIVSYNHLGNNDGKNLSAPQQFRSKEISKSNVVDDMVHANQILYKPGEHPDHVVVIKYVPFVSDSKRAMDEYTSRIFMNGMNTIVMHNTCEDSLLAAPLILDLAILAEFFTRVSWKTEKYTEFQSLHPVLSILGYLTKAPLVPPNTPVINALAKQRAAIENVLRALIGLAPENSMMLEHRAIPRPHWGLWQKGENMVTVESYPDLARLVEAGAGAASASGVAATAAEEEKEE